MHETSDFFYSILTFSYTKYFVHSYTVGVVFTVSYLQFKNISILLCPGTWVTSVGGWNMRWVQNNQWG